MHQHGVLTFQTVFLMFQDLLFWIYLIYHSLFLFALSLQNNFKSFRLCIEGRRNNTSDKRDHYNPHESRSNRYKFSNSGYGSNAAITDRSEGHHCPVHWSWDWLERCWMCSLLRSNISRMMKRWRQLQKGMLLHTRIFSPNISLQIDFPLQSYIRITSIFSTILKFAGS